MTPSKASGRIEDKPTRTPTYFARPDKQKEPAHSYQRKRKMEVCNLGHGDISPCPKMPGLRNAVIIIYFSASAPKRVGICTRRGIVAAQLSIWCPTERSTYKNPVCDLEQVCFTSWEPSQSEREAHCRHHLTTHTICYYLIFCVPSLHSLLNTVLASISSNKQQDLILAEWGGNGAVMFIISEVKLPTLNNLIVYMSKYWKLLGQKSKGNW